MAPSPRQQTLLQPELQRQPQSQPQSQLQPQPHGAKRNHLLRALPDADFDDLSRHLESVTLRLGESIYEPGGRPPHAVFPTTSIVSLHYVTATGASAETAGVGNEGMVGVALFMGGDTTASSARVLVAGDAYRLPAGQLRLAFDRVGSLRGLLLRHVQSLMSQTVVVAACNRHHPIEQQFCRWLLSTLDRAPSGDLTMTQELVSHTLGVRRESITAAASKLQDGGYIRYRRGNISILDPAGLESRACECYAVVRAEIQRLLQRAPAVAGYAHL